MRLNENQKEVINFGKGTLLVEAGPGSGKTTVIINRIINLIENGVNPEEFLVITFTRKAAENLKNKLKTTLSDETISKMQISTIHSFCLNYLKTKNQFLNLIDDDSSEKKALFIQKFKDKLGFTDEYTLLDYQISSVIGKFGEYTCFNVNSKELTNYIKDTRPISEDYINFINSLNHFSKKRVEDNNLKDDWYNARYLQIAKAYPIYLKLLDEHDYVDYDTLQLKTLKELKKDPETPYNCILIDEFQDTDPLQFKIFEILRKNADYFTAVGDVDQHIYAFRSSYSDYFKELYENAPQELISLNTNYRSTNDIVELTEEFIEDYRKDYSQKHMVSYNPGYTNSSLIIKADSPHDEANQIFNTIQYLKQNKNVNYEDIAVLYRKHYNKTIPELIKLLDENDINFTIRGQSDLKDQVEVKSILLLLWYITRRTDNLYVSSQDELKELNLKGFCTDSDEDTIWSLADETKQYLTTLQDSYHDELLSIENEIRQKNGKNKVRAVYNIKKNEDQDTLYEIFGQVEKPVVDLSKITNEKDRQFFQKLEVLRSKIHFEESLTCLDVYYQLLSLSDYLIDIDENFTKANNLAALTQTIYNYEEFISQTDVKGLFFFLNRMIGDYSSYYSNEGGVQLMTIHAAKGLEFPVTIVATLEKDKFPMKIKDPNREKNYINGKETFYTPTRFLRYKDIPIDDEVELSIEEYDNRLIEEENKLDEAEEAHILYVAMTRAADLLIVSCCGEVPQEISKIAESLTHLSEDALSDVIINKHAPEPEDEKLKLNYSSYSTYNLCPFMYNLIYNLGFRVSSENVTHLGTVFHEIMENVNLKLKDNQQVSKEELKNITREIYSSMFDINQTQDEFEELEKSVLNYYDTYSLNHEVLESELPFEIERENYILNGAIDLIYKISDTEIAILDYKNAEHDDNKIAHYEKQLYIYASALKEMSEFDNYTVKKAITHFVKTDYKHEVEITDEKINTQLDKLNDVALKIINEEFPKRESNFCRYCKYRVIC
ncbi:MAG: ATP-dependent helicase [Methanobrevibacter sp.]|uniref:ATP-dependent helicase n=1 Tax=Methanobrevibacter sp. TaxID=66852 RepID=UPI0025FAD810|nr:ATP-dependent DNA helicase [Methanobrevibacter sp.]MBR3112540.1 ATP-dependent helicase [Methanobrevibacter sp.]